MTTDWLNVARLSTIEKGKDDPMIRMAAQRLKEEGLVAFPTETVYGLGANATSDIAVRRIFEAKGRPSDNPLIIHVGSTNEVEKWVESIPPVAQMLMDSFFPGPITLILRHNGRLSKRVTAGLDTVGIRVPAHPVAIALLQLAELPIAAPSANRSGKPSPTSAEHVWQDLSGRIDYILDGGVSGVGVESTVIDCTIDQPILLRPGGISKEEIEERIGPIVIAQEEGKPRSPGMKYRHYAPKAEMWLVAGEIEPMKSQIQALIHERQLLGKKVGVLTTSEHEEFYSEADVTIACGSRKDAVTVASQLYQSLRSFDQTEVDEIYCETFPEQGLYLSVMNRLLKAADGKVIGLESKV